MSTPSRQPSRITSSFMVVGEIVGLLVQVLLIGLGWSIVRADVENTDEIVVPLILWCIVATLFLATVIVWLNFLARRPRDESATVRLLIAHPAARIVAMVTTFLSSFIGLTVALDLIISLGMDHRDPVFEVGGVWAMLLSWAMFNWGYSRIYYSRYHRAVRRRGEAPLTFPGTETPGLVDFVYLSFTNATTFAVSDVKVTSSHMRWTIVWHTSIAFFFNALIIVLSMNLISSGKLLENLFD